MVSYIIFGLTLAFAAAVQPGPFQAYLINQTIKNGWRATLPAAAAPMISDVPIAILALFLLNSIPENIVYLLRIPGGLFLLFLAYKSFITWRTYDVRIPVEKNTSQRTVVNAVIVNILNPAPYIGWSLILGPLFLEGWRDEKIFGVALVVCFYLTMFITTAGIIVLFAFTRRLGPQVSKTLLGISAIALGIFGVYQLTLGLSILVK